MDDAHEQSTYVITIAFTDEDGAAVTPTAATWTLSDKDGNIINSRDGVTIASLDTSVTVVLSGDDLAYQSETDTGERKFLIEATYDSSLGTGLPFRKEVTFFVVNAVNV